MQRQPLVHSIAVRSVTQSRLWVDRCSTSRVAGLTRTRRCYLLPSAQYETSLCLAVVTDTQSSTLVLPDSVAAHSGTQQLECRSQSLPRSIHTTSPASTFASSTAASHSALSSLPSLPPHHSSPPARLSRAAAADPSTHINSAASNPFYTLGLDINTQSIGYVLLSPSLLTLQRGLITLSHLASTSTPAARLRHVSEQLSAVLASLPSEARVHTAVESYLLSFSGRCFQTRHLFQLAAFNSQVQCLLWQATGRGEWPAVVNVNTARSRFGLKGEVTDGKAGRRVSDVKGVVWRWVDERLRREKDDAAAAEAVGGVGATDVEWRRKRDGGVHATMYDISDAYLIALTAAMDRTQQQSTHTAVGERDSAGKESVGEVETADDSEVSVETKLRRRKVRKVQPIIGVVASSINTTDNSNKQARTSRIKL